MTVGSSYDTGVLRVYLSGELDHHAAKRTVGFIEKKIDTHLPREMVLDMKDLTFMDSSGIAVILKTYRRMKEIGGDMQVINTGKQPQRVLNASGVERIVKIIAETKEA
jgi:stage II sporulation protein AA (anti-sigma F factor antagonist)